jgi:hypothetical protein
MSITTRSAGRPLQRWVLSVVLLHELLLFTAFTVAAWQRRSPENPLTLTGERLVICADGLGYYAWLRSLLIDGDWDFDNEFDLHNPLGKEVSDGRTVLGRRANPFSVGPACLWAPAVALTHAARLVGLGTAWPADGYSLPYQIAVGVTALLVAAAALACLYGICRLYTRPGTAALAVAFLTFGTTLLNYSAIEVTMGHGSGAAATALFVWYWLKTYGSMRNTRWLAVGALVGLITLMRWQLATLALLPAGEWTLAAWRAWRKGAPFQGWARVGCIALAAGAALIMFIPQMVAWRAVYGSWLVSPMPLNHNWWRPHLARVLIESDRSLFYWTPLTLLPVLGYVLCLGPIGRFLAARSIPREPLALLFMAFVTQVYLLASITGSGVYLGSAFGFRQLTEAVVLLAPGLALLLEVTPPRSRRWLIAGCLLVSAWNVLVMAQYHKELLPRAAGASPSMLVMNVASLVGAWPGGTVLFLLFLTGPALLAVTLLWHRASWESETRAEPG